MEKDGKGKEYNSDGKLIFEVVYLNGNRFYKLMNKILLLRLFINWRKIIIILN